MTGFPPPDDRPTMGELAGKKIEEGKVRRCPDCHRRLFYVTNTWTLADGTIRRLRKCSACGYVIDSREVYDK